jgi:integrase/recombinase XerC
VKKAEFLKYLKQEKNYSNYTITSYGIDLTQFEEFLNRIYENEQEKEINAKIIRVWLMELSEKGISSRSIDRKIAALRSYFRFVEKEDKDFINPMPKIIAPKMSKRKPVFIFEDDIERLLSQKPKEDDIMDLRNYMIIEILYATGMRRGEILGLKDDDINFYNKEIKVFGKRSKERIIPIGDELIDTITKYIDFKRRCELRKDVFLVNKDNKPMSKKQLYDMVEKKLMGINISKRSPHVFRHTCATHLLNEGADINNVKNLLGHSSLSATEVYTHTTIEELKKEYKRSFPGAE